MFGQEGWLQAQQQWLFILDQAAAVAVVSGLRHWAAKRWRILLMQFKKRELLCFC